MFPQLLMMMVTINGVSCEMKQLGWLPLDSKTTEENRKYSRQIAVWPFSIQGL